MRSHARSLHYITIWIFLFLQNCNFQEKCVYCETPHNCNTYLEKLRDSLRVENKEKKANLYFVIKTGDGPLFCISVLPGENNSVLLVTLLCLF